jgi:excisionase family DNA binding protein
MEPTELVDVNEAARVTGLDKSTLYKLVNQKRLRSFKVLGTALRFDRRDVLALIREVPARYE